MFDVDALVEYIRRQDYECYVIYRAIILFTYTRGEKLSFSLALSSIEGMDVAKLYIDYALYHFDEEIQKRALAV